MKERLRLRVTVGALVDVGRAGDEAGVCASLVVRGLLDNGWTFGCGTGLVVR